MSLFRMTQAGDLDRGPDNVGFSRVIGIEESRVALHTRMKLYKGEVRRDKRVGVNFQWAMQPTTPNTHVANHLASVAVGTPGIVDIQLRYNFFGPEGAFVMDMKAEYETDDHEARVKSHETVLVRPNANLGGSPDNANN